jgi:subtilisin family serine protease
MATEMTSAALPQPGRRTVRRSAACVTTAVALLGVGLPAVAAEQVDQYIVVSTTADATLDLPGRVDVVEQYPQVGAALVSTTAAVADALDSSPGVVVAADAPVTATDIKPAADPGTVGARRLVPVEAAAVRTAASWGIDRIDQRRGTDGVYRTRPGIDGAGVHVYVIDTGLALDHPEFAGRVGAGQDFVGDGQGVSDCDGHGTHVAGIIGSSVFGVAPASIIHPVRVLDCTGSGLLSDVVEALDWIKTVAPRASVANASLGGSYNPAVNAAVDNFVSSGTPLVVAAGNESQPISWFSPASATRATTVMASDEFDDETIFTNYGPEADIFAPGENICSTYYLDSTQALCMDGTSQASPHVAGFMALRLQRFPRETVADTKQALYNQATDGVIDTYFSGYPRDLVYTYGVAWPLSLTLASVSNRSKLRIDVDPDEATWRVRIEKAKASGGWRLLRSTTTTAPDATRTVDVGAGRYRVTLPAQHGYSRTVSSAVLVAR